MVSHAFVILSFIGLTTLSSAKVTRVVSERALNEAIDQDGDVFIMFYAPWCGHCKEFLPKFEEASETIEAEGLNVKFLKMDAETHKEVATTFGVNGFPTLRYFKQNEEQVVDATDIDRTTENIVSWVQRVHTAPDRVTHLTDMEALNGFLEKSNGVYVVGHFEDRDHAEMFISVAKDFKFPVLFAWTIEPEAANVLGLTTPNSAVLFKPFDEKKVTMKLENPLEGTKKSKAEMAEMMHKMIGVPIDEALKLIPAPKGARAFKDWVKTMMMPLVVPMNDAFMDLIFSGPVQLHLITIFNPDDEETFRSLQTQIEEVAMTHRGEVLHIMLPSVEETLEMRRFFKVDQHTLPTAVLSDMRDLTEELPQGTQKVFPRKQKFNMENLLKFEEQALKKKPTKTDDKTTDKSEL